MKSIMKKYPRLGTSLVSHTHVVRHALNVVYKKYYVSTTNDKRALR